MIDPTKPVKLLKLAVKGGNHYHPRIYNPGDLPDEIMARTDILDQSFLKPVPDSVVATPTVKVSDDDTVQNQVSFSVEVPSTTPKAYPTETVQIKPKTDINKATIDELSKLPGVGVTTATKLDKEREKEPFSSVADLDARIPLKGKSWEELSPQILIQ